MGAVHRGQVSTDVERVEQHPHRPPTVRRHALLDLPSLLLHVHVEWEVAPPSFGVQRRDVLDSRGADAVRHRAEALGPAIED
jgi:hypothetical protein